jgi:hypothetical protein
MKRVIQAWVVLVVLAPIGNRAYAEECDTPLPANVTRPTQQAETGNLAFIGVWGNAKWDNKLCHTLVVESVDADGNAQIVYSYGVYEKWGIKRPGYMRDKALIVDSTLVMDGSKDKARVEYKLVDGKLKGKYILPDMFVLIEMTRK